MALEQAERKHREGEVSSHSPPALKATSPFVLCCSSVFALVLDFCRPPGPPDSTLLETLLLQVSPSLALRPTLPEAGSEVADGQYDTSGTCLSLSHSALPLSHLP